jgi:hypothetical protein
MRTTGILTQAQITAVFKAAKKAGYASVTLEASFDKNVIKFTAQTEDPIERKHNNGDGAQPDAEVQNIESLI